MLTVSSRMIVALISGDLNPPMLEPLADLPFPFLISSRERIERLMTWVMLITKKGDGVFLSAVTGITIKLFFGTFQDWDKSPHDLE